MTTEKIEAVEEFLRDTLPGGRYILPHWQDGPFYLVPVLDTAGANYQALLLLEAFEPLVQNLPVYSFGLHPVDVYAVPQFVNDMLIWHQEEYGLQLDMDAPLDAFEVMPTEQDVLDNLGSLTNLDTEEIDDELREQLQGYLDALREAGPVALRALSAIDRDAVRVHDSEDRDVAASTALTLLATAATIVAATPT